MRYHPNASKTYLVVKQEHKVNVTQLPVSSPPPFSKTFTEEYVSKKVQGWTKEIMQLAEVAVSQPHAAYAAFTHGLLLE